MYGKSLLFSLCAMGLMATHQAAAGPQRTFLHGPPTKELPQP